MSTIELIQQCELISENSLDAQFHAIKRHTEPQPSVIVARVAAGAVAGCKEEAPSIPAAGYVAGYDTPGSAEEDVLCIPDAGSVPGCGDSDARGSAEKRPRILD